jgi:hypothetical protein
MIALPIEGTFEHIAATTCRPNLLENLSMIFLSRRKKGTL